MKTNCKKYHLIVGGATSGLAMAAIRYMLEQGHTVTALMRATSRRRPLFDEQMAETDTSRLQMLYLDFKQYCDLECHADAFLNFAWEGTTGNSRFDAQMQACNLTNADSALRHAAAMGCRVYADAGSQAEYGWQNGLTNETTPCEPFSDYGRAKLQSWLTGRKTAQSLGIAFVHPRIFSTYGETENEAAMIPYIIRSIIEGKKVELTHCEQSWNYLYRRDAARMICELVLSHIECAPVQEIYNIASLDTRPLKEFVTELTDTIGIDCILEFGAHRPQRLLSLMPDISKTLATIGTTQFTPFAEGIKREYQYLRQQYT